MSNGCKAVKKITADGFTYCDQPSVQNIAVWDDGAYYTLDLCTDHVLDYAPDDEVMSDRPWDDGPFLPVDLVPPF